MTEEGEGQIVMMPMEALEQMLSVAYIAGYKTKELKLGGDGLMFAAREHAVRAIRAEPWKNPAEEEPEDPEA